MYPLDAVVVSVWTGSQPPACVLATAGSFLSPNRTYKHGDSLDRSPN